MPYWTIVYFPPVGERQSAYDFIVGLQDEGDKTQISHRLSTLCQIEKMVNWPPGWCKKVDKNLKLYQLTASGSRVYYCVDGRKIVVLYACKKTGRKAKSKDLDMARKHYKDYMAEKGTKSHG